METAIHSRHTTGTRGTTSASSPQSTNPWSRWVKLAGSSKCWEVFDPQYSLVHSSTRSQEQIQSRPCWRSWYTPPARTAAIASHGSVLLIVGPPGVIPGVACRLDGGRGAGPQGVVDGGLELHVGAERDRVGEREDLGGP